ncbi:YoaK family protein [Agitococcus lubricus]|uniref:Uncharacterized membrane protein YoaK (UPF0700 family) n=1 Tax=Agitococcus lubricus TaxID=1077255 RepID=A0A2T5IZV4_9GAMM|nr:YoaK family protein [Agitococcus lubricus]PTQ89572.1 uncharacterized membrane protein YoaK (UPF0700 family) [Agitococcus lubricus]
MTKKLPAWIEIGAFVLAFVAGIINVVGLLGFHHQSVSHLTGSASLLSLKVVQGEWDITLHLLGVLFSFFLGAMLAGVIIQNATLRLGKRYGIALMLESLMLWIALQCLIAGSHGGDFWASAACGLQNAMVSTYSGAMIRTTHITGTVTDLGSYLGQRLRGIPVEARRFWLYLLLIAGFMCGGLVGAASFMRWHYHSLYIPIATTGVLSALYWGYWYHTKRL